MILWSLLALPPLIMEMYVRNHPFIGTPDSLGKLQLNVRILDKWEPRIPGKIQRTNQTEA